MKWLDDFKTFIKRRSSPYRPLKRDEMLRNSLEEFEYLKRVCGINDEDSAIDVISKTAETIKRLRGENIL